MYASIKLVVFLTAAFAKPNCHYSTWTWDIKAGRAVNHEKVEKNRSKLAKDEKDPFSNCTICEEDQVWVRLKGISPFRVCRYYVKPIKKILIEAKEKGFPIYEVIAYRVGKSRGEADERGLRTKYSNHSYGSAIDINANFNGLYDQCFIFNSQCKLIRGGRWNSSNPAAITKNSVLYQQFLKMGWKWGGELKGKQKDFMHFSKGGD